MRAPRLPLEPSPPRMGGLSQNGYTHTHTHTFESQVKKREPKKRGTGPHKCVDTNPHMHTHAQKERDRERSMYSGPLLVEKVEQLEKPPADMTMRYASPLHAELRVHLGWKRSIFGLAKPKYIAKFAENIKCTVC